MTEAQDCGNHRPKLSVPATLKWIFQLVGVLFVLVACGPTKEDIYLSDVQDTLNKFATVLTNYNRGIDEIAEKYRSGDQLRATQLILEHVEESNEGFKEISLEFPLIIPPKRFVDFHILMASAIRDIVRATNGQVTYYTTVLATGERDKFLADRSSELLKSSNEDKQKAVYMYLELTGEKLKD